MLAWDQTLLLIFGLYERKIKEKGVTKPLLGFTVISIRNKLEQDLLFSLLHVGTANCCSFCAADQHCPGDVSGINLMDTSRTAGGHTLMLMLEDPPLLSTFRSGLVLGLQYKLDVYFSCSQLICKSLCLTRSAQQRKRQKWKMLSHR